MNRVKFFDGSATEGKVGFPFPLDHAMKCFLTEILLRHFDLSVCPTFYKWSTETGSTAMASICCFYLKIGFKDGLLTPGGPSAFSCQCHAQCAEACYVLLVPNRRRVLIQVVNQETSIVHDKIAIISY